MSLLATPLFYCLTLLPPALHAQAVELPAVPGVPADRGEPAMRTAVAQTRGLKRDDPRWRDALLAAYEKRAWLPMWSQPSGVGASARALLTHLQAAADLGLDPAEYGVQALQIQAAALAATSSPSTAARCTFDAALSLAAARFISDLHSGRISPRTVGHDLDVPHAALDIGTAIAAVAGSGDVGAVIADYEPAFRHYVLLKTALAHYRELATDATLTQLPPLPARSVKPGERYAGVAALRKLLGALGDLPAVAEPVAAAAAPPPSAAPTAAPPASPSAAPSTPSQVPAANDLLDDSLVAALRHFQERHGLRPDGTLGAGTFTALTTPLSQRVRQIELSLERSRWLPPTLDSPPILVNIPQFRLFGFYTTDDRESLLLQMNVIVGKTFPRNNTPVFAADMRFVVIRPYWDVPSTILRDEFLPKIRANPGWLARNRFELVAGQGDDSPVVPASAENIAALARGALRLRQLPGDSNSLGIAKLMFPNRHNVYLHGTPAQGLFAEPRRAFSHGCVRLEDPLSMAAFVLRDQPQWTREKLVELARLDRPTRIPLTRPLRVFIFYATAIATEAGNVLFFEDIYGHDRKLTAALAKQHQAM